MCPGLFFYNYYKHKFSLSLPLFYTSVNTHKPNLADIAQLVEQFIRNE
jgi:hypothetical protein